MNAAITLHSADVTLERAGIANTFSWSLSSTQSSTASASASVSSTQATTTSQSLSFGASPSQSRTTSRTRTRSPSSTHTPSNTPTQVSASSAACSIRGITPYHIRCLTDSVVSVHYYALAEQVGECPLQSGREHEDYPTIFHCRGRSRHRSPLRHRLVARQLITVLRIHQPRQAPSLRASSSLSSASRSSLPPSSRLLSRCLESALASQRSAPASGRVARRPLPVPLRWAHRARSEAGVRHMLALALTGRRDSRGAAVRPERHQSATQCVCSNLRLAPPTAAGSKFKLNQERQRDQQ